MPRKAESSLVATRYVLLVVLAALGACDRSSAPAPLESATPPEPRAASSSSAPTSDAAACRRGAQRDLVYRREGAQPVHRLDLEIPESGNDLPLVVYVHGGAWREGDRRQVFDKPAFFGREGFAFASVDYRLSTPESGVSHPMHVEDVAAAVAWLEEHAREYCIDPKRIVAMGHSAGGYIVAALGADVRHLRKAGASPRTLRCVMVNDTEGFDLPRLFAKRDRGWIRETYENAFGSDEALWRDASPIRHVSAHPGLPHFLLVTRGSEERKGQVAAFAEAVRAASGIAFVVDAEPRDHLEIDRKLGAVGDDLGPTTVLFYRRCLGMDRPFAPR